MPDVTLAARRRYTAGMDDETAALVRGKLLPLLWDFHHERLLGNRQWALEALREARPLYRRAYRAGFRWRQHAEDFGPLPETVETPLKKYSLR